jgi:hypothetical protein
MAVNRGNDSNQNFHVAQNQERIRVIGAEVGQRDSSPPALESCSFTPDRSLMDSILKVRQ